METKKINWFISKAKKYQVITFTLSFLFVYRFVVVLLYYLADKKLFLETYNLDILFFIIVIPIVYFLQWLIVIWVATKFPKEKLKQRFFAHPILTIIFSILYIADLPYRLAESEVGGGVWKIVGIFEALIYYAIITFLWWLLISWISSKIFKKQKFQWIWYKRIIDRIFITLPAIFKFILGLIVAIFIFLLLFILLSALFKYTGQDLKTLVGNK